MRYFGGKQRISKDLSTYLNSRLSDGQSFFDLFCGSCNIVSKIAKDRVRVANDIHPELIAMWIAVQQGRELPTEISESEYYDIKKAGEPWLRGFVGFGCSYSGKWWGGYARGGQDRNYCMNARNTTLKKASDMRDVVFTCQSYETVPLLDNAMLYCDIPYKDTTGYSSGAFDHTRFYSWAESKAAEGYEVIVSEYEHNVPCGWAVVWSKGSKKDIRNASGIQERTTEVLMMPVI